MVIMKNSSSLAQPSPVESHSSLLVALYIYVHISKITSRVQKFHSVVLWCGSLFIYCAEDIIALRILKLISFFLKI